MSHARVSAVIVNWNHGSLLPACLDALLALGHEAELEVVVVDNGSTDGSPGWLPQRYPAVRLWALADNRGFSAALNWGIAHTAGQAVLSLNPDVTVQAGFLAHLVEAMEQDARIGTVAPKLLQAARPELLDSTGLFIDRRRRPYDRGQGEPDRGQYDGHTAAFGACGAAALYRRTMLEDIALDGEMLDETFFAYYEDADLAWRAQLRGWRAVHAPGAVARHDRGRGDTLRRRGRASKGSQGPRLALRNRYLMALKNDRAAYFLADLPWILGSDLPRLAYAAVARPAVLLGLLDLVRALPAGRRARRLARGRRTVDDASLRGWFLGRR